MFHATWILAAFSYGRLPRPYLDDPKNIEANLCLDLCYAATWMLLTATLPAIGLNLAAVITCGVHTASRRANGQWRMFFLATAVACTLWGTGFLLLARDPFGAVTWFMD